MATVSQIIDAFSKAESRDRIVLIVGLLKLCTPSELRFVLTSLEDLASGCLHQYQNIESEANDCKRLASLARPDASLDDIIGQAVLFTSFLRRDNLNGARVMVHVLEEVMRRTRQKMLATALGGGAGGDGPSDPAHESAGNGQGTSLMEVSLVGDLLLLFTLASHHSAFNFSSRVQLHNYLQQLHNAFQGVTEDQQIPGSSPVFSDGVTSMFSSSDSTELANDNSSSFVALSAPVSTNGIENCQNDIEDSVQNHQKTAEIKVTQRLASYSESQTFAPDEQLRDLPCDQAASSTDFPSHVERASAANLLDSNPSNGFSSQNTIASCSSVSFADSESDCDVTLLPDASVETTFETSLVSEERYRHQVVRSCVAAQSSASGSLSPVSISTSSSGCSKSLVSAKTLLEKLISTNLVDDAKVELAKEKRRSIGGGSVAPCHRSLDSGSGSSSATQDSTLPTSEPVDEPAYFASTGKDLTNPVDCLEKSDRKDEEEEALAADSSNIPDDSSIASEELVPDRRYSMPVYLPSNLLPLLGSYMTDSSAKVEEKAEKVKSEAKSEDSRGVKGGCTVVARQPSDGRSSRNSGSTVDFDENKTARVRPARTLSDVVETGETPKRVERKTRSYHTEDHSAAAESPTPGNFVSFNRNACGNSVSYARNGFVRNGGSQGGGRGAGPTYTILTSTGNRSGNLNYGKHHDQGQARTSSYVGGRSYYVRNGSSNGRNGHSAGGSNPDATSKTARQSYHNNNKVLWTNGGSSPSQQNRMHQVNNSSYQPQQQQQQQMTFQNHQTLQHQQSALFQQQQKMNAATLSAAFGVQQLSAATTMSPTQGYLTHYITAYPADYTQAIRTQPNLVNNGNCGGNATFAQNVRLQHSFQRGATPTFYQQHQGGPLYLTNALQAYGSVNGLQQVLCPELVTAQSPQACFFDPTVPPPPLVNAPYQTVQVPQVMFYDPGALAKPQSEEDAKLTCSNCASTDHRFQECPHPIPIPPR